MKSFLDINQYIVFYCSDTSVECQLTYKHITPDKNVRTSHLLLHPGMLRGVNLNIVYSSRISDLTHPKIDSMLAYKTLKNIDPCPSNEHLDTLGYV